MSGFSVQKNKVIDTNCCICYDVQDAAFFAEFANLRLRIPKGAGMLWTVFFLKKPDLDSGTRMAFSRPGHFAGYQKGESICKTRNPLSASWI